MKNVTIYTTATCHFCHAAKEFFTANNIPFTNHDVTTDPTAQREMIDRSGQMGVPVIFIDDEMAIGFDEQKVRGLLGM